MMIFLFYKAYRTKTVKNHNSKYSLLGQILHFPRNLGPEKETGTNGGKKKLTFC